MMHHHFQIELMGQINYADLMRDPQCNCANCLNEITNLFTLKLLPPQDSRIANNNDTIFSRGRAKH